MRTVTKLACPLAIVATCAFASSANAQFEGAEQIAQFAPMMEEMAPLMEQMAPMVRMMKVKIGKRRIAQMMQMVGPMTSMVSMGGADMSSLAGMPGIESLASMMGGGSAAHPRRRRK